MSDPERRRPGACAFPWCATPHGTTAHPDDEDHRSAGVLVPITARTGGGAVDTDVEVGLLRRRTDTETWLVLEDGGDVRLELTLASVARLCAEVHSDAVLRDAVGEGLRARAWP